MRKNRVLNDWLYLVESEGTARAAGCESPSLRQHLTYPINSVDKNEEMVLRSLPVAAPLRLYRISVKQESCFKDGFAGGTEAIDSLRLFLLHFGLRRLFGSERLHRVDRSGAPRGND